MSIDFIHKTLKDTTGPTGCSRLPGRSMMSTWPLLRGIAWIIVLPVSVESKVHPPRTGGVAGPTPTKLVNDSSPANSKRCESSGVQQDGNCVPSFEDLFMTLQGRHQGLKAHVS